MEQKYDFDRQLPHNIEAEQIVLGSVLLDPESIGFLAETLQVEHFYAKRHQLIFEAMLEMFDGGTPIEGVLLLSRLREQGEFTSEDDSQYLYLLAENASSVKNIEYYNSDIEQLESMTTIVPNITKMKSFEYLKNATNLYIPPTVRLSINWNRIDSEVNAITDQLVALICYKNLIISNLSCRITYKEIRNNSLHIFFRH